MANKRDKAWITCITRDSYLAGALTLSKSLENVKSEYPLILLHTDAVSQQTLESLARQPNVELRLIQPYKIKSKYATSYAFERFQEAWNKMRCWQVADVSVLCWLDADMLVVQNMDEIFDLLPMDRELAACPSCTCNVTKIASYPAAWTPENCILNQCKPKPGHQKNLYFNAGLLLFRPSLSTLTSFEAFIDKEARVETWTFAEQDGLNEYYAGQWVPLPYGYNALKTISLIHPDLWDLASIKNIHYILEKPWDDPSNEQKAQAPYMTLNSLWWETYNQVV